MLLGFRKAGRIMYGWTGRTTYGQTGQRVDGQMDGTDGQQTGVLSIRSARNAPDVDPVFHTNFEAVWRANNIDVFP